MRKSIALFWAAAVLAQPVFAAVAPTRVAIVSIQKIFESSHAFRKFQVMLQMKGKEAEKKFLAIQKELEKKNNALMSLQSTLPEAQWKERKKVFDLEVAAFQEQVQERKQELESAQQKIAIELQGHIQSILSKLSEKKGFTLVLEQQVIVWNSKDIIDVTEDVIPLLNEAVPDLKMPFKEDAKEREAVK